MSDQGGSCTLIFYKIGDAFWNEPFLNLLAAAAQLSSFTHVELAIGDAAGSFGQMSNVARIFNDDAGVELTSRTGRNPQYSYVQLGCSKNAENIMLAYAQSLVGKPFSNVGMARSILYPRKTDGSSFFCAELVAAILKKGGLMSSSSNPGAATPHSLYNLYKNQAAITANPYTLRQFSNIKQGRSGDTFKGIGFSNILENQQQSRAAYRQNTAPRKRGDSPPRASFRLVPGNSGQSRGAESVVLLRR